MPELSGTQVVAFVAFAALILAWLMAPGTAVVAAEREPLPEAA